MLTRILAEHPDLAHDGVLGPPLLERAAGLGYVPCIAALLAAGMPADEPDEVGVTALMSACWEGRLEAARLLLEAGADPNAVAEEDGSYRDPDDSGRCALYYALYKGHRDLIELLEPITSLELHTRARETAEERRACGDEDDEETPQLSEPTTHLFMAAMQDRIDRLRESIAAGADVNAMLDPGASNRLYGSTPLSFAAGRSRMDLVEALLQAGADPGLRDHLGRTTADIAALNGRDEIAVRLRSTLRPNGAE